ncbi:MAG: SSU ribosomal protein S14p (S29e) @ SSU ribosomal protein S14p (S29e), zinc-dependent, partial [uncultured Thermomicrobiales bacterium]
GQEIDDREGGAHPEVHRARLQSLQALRAFARVYAEVRHLPDLLPRVGLHRPPAGCDQGEFL